MNTSPSEPIIDEDVIEQLGSVRETGQTNMMDRAGVGLVANSLGHSQLSYFCAQLEFVPRHRRAEIWMEALTKMGERVASS